MDWLGGLDLRPGPLVASFFGGMAYAVVLKVRDPSRLASIFVVGMGSSLFLGPLLSEELSTHFVSVSEAGIANASGFVMGLGGMAICNGIIAMINKIVARKVEESGEGK